jgi:adenosylcobinamide-GDP ribazoletransferase
MYAALRLEAKLFLLATRYLTRLPVPHDLPVSDDLMVRAVKYHPTVGALVGALGAVTLWSASLVLPWTAAILLSLVTTLLVTGAFHEQGFADAAEGLATGRDRTDVISAMDGARFGVAGGVTLAMVLALKTVLLGSFPVAVACAALIAGQAVGRMASVHVTATTVHARSEGMRKFVPAVTHDGYRIALASALVVLVVLIAMVGTVATFCGFLGAVALAQAFRRFFLSRIGGYTGDCLGGSQQLGELGLYLGVALWL